MRRAIRFRGKSVKTGEWLYGSLIEAVDGRVAIVPVFDGQLVHGADYMVRPDTVGECTGLKDRDGRMIYEDDVLEWWNRRYPGTNGLEKHLGTVEWSIEDGFFGVGLGLIGYIGLNDDELMSIPDDDLERYEKEAGITASEHYGVKVVGNVYDNPDMADSSADVTKGGDL